MITFLIGLVVGSFFCLVAPPTVKMFLRRREIRAVTQVKPMAFG